MQLTSKGCGTCSAPLLDDLERVTSYCDACGTVWLDKVVHNPLAEVINLDVEMIARFDEIFERCG